MGIGQSLLPHRLAVGIEGGCEIDARLAQVIYATRRLLTRGARRCAGSRWTWRTPSIGNCGDVSSKLSAILPSGWLVCSASSTVSLYLASGEHNGKSVMALRQGGATGDDFLLVAG